MTIDARAASVESGVKVTLNNKGDYFIGSSKGNSITDGTGADFISLSGSGTNNDIFYYKGGADSMTVTVTLNPGQQMNYHSHEKRDEIWNVIHGTGRTIVDGMEQAVKAGDVITMAAGCKHTVIADTELQLIEVQLGSVITVSDKKKYEQE